ncbi:uncharacterized protein [Mytilus edulis]|uniref:uncharacterized protein n=1 Tax=Mytilus edulis TaxID=6550 RepID=UPI0039F1033E
MAIRVAVIGAGAAGLCAVRHLTARPNIFHTVCFDKNPSEGGTWIYTEETGSDKYGLPVQSSMYKNLRTNLPKEVMAFPGFPFRSSLPSFIKHDDVLEYLQEYTKHYDLHKCIKFETLVQHVRPEVDGDKTHWHVSYSNVGQRDETKTEIFDVVMVCNGHYEVPLYPKIPGLDDFEGEVIHSHCYRHPEQFTGKRVVCLGAAASGQDIAVDVSSCAKYLYMSHNKAVLQTVLPNNVEQRPGIKQLNKHSVIFKDDSEEEIDVLLLCTGYLYNFPFLSEDIGLQVEEERIWPLYKHVIHTHYPSLSFIGILKTICPFPAFDMQVRFVIAGIDGSMPLPSEEEMKKDIDKDFKLRLSEGLPVRYAHNMGPKQWRYNDGLAEMAKIKPLPQVVEKLYDYVHETRVKDIAGYKSVNYSIEGDKDMFKVVET